MEPPPARRIGGIACFTARKAPSRLIACCRRQSANAISSSGTMRPMPALATMTSRRPNRLSAAAMIWGQRASSVTSWSRNRAFPPTPAILLARLSPPSRSMSVATTLAPARASVSAHAAPIPEAAPVTIATLPSMRMRLPPRGVPPLSGRKRALPIGDHVGAKEARLLAARADRCAFDALARLEPQDHEIAVLEAGIGRVLERMNEGAVVGDVGGEGSGRNRGLGDALQRRGAVEAMRGAAKEPQRCLASREPDGLHVALHLHGRAPIVAVAHQDANLGVAHGGIEELVPGPGIGSEHGPEPVPRPDRRIGEPAGGCAQYG